VIRLSDASVVGVGAVTMNPEEVKKEIQRLITEAPQIAPSITLAKGEDLRPVTDDKLDHQRALTWQIEANNLLRELPVNFGPVFGELEAKHLADRNVNVRAKSILIHWTRQNLQTALDLFDSAIMKMVPPRTNIRRGAPLLTPSASVSPAKTGNSLEPPEKVTIPWLVRHVPISGWGIGIGLLVGAFLLGVRMADVPWFRAFLKAITADH